MNKEFNYSFIIPHKNCPDLLQRCVDSIPEREDVQIIVIDDNSDADKKPSIDRKGVEVILLDAEHSKGAGRARNVGLERAKGKWLLFADSDDSYLHGFINILDQYKDVDFDVLYFNSIHMDSKTNKPLNRYGFQERIDNYNGSKDDIDYIRFMSHVPWNKMVSRKFVIENNISFEEVPNGNDLFFSLQVGYMSEIRKVEKSFVYNYYTNENSLLTSKKQSYDKKICRILHAIKKNGFLQKVGRKEWKTSIRRKILKELMRDSFTSRLLFVLNLLKIMLFYDKIHNEWISSIIERKVKLC